MTGGICDSCHVRALLRGGWCEQCRVLESGTDGGHFTVCIQPNGQREAKRVPARHRIAPVAKARRTWERTEEFTVHDAADLEFYFKARLPPAHGASSLFGAMCQRVGEATNPSTKEIPDGPECEWVQCSGTAHAGKIDSIEEGMIRYLEAHNRVKRAHGVLRVMASAQVDVLEARYAKAAPTTEHLAARDAFGSLWEVAQFTESAAKLRAESGEKDYRNRRLQVRLRTQTAEEQEADTRGSRRYAITAAVGARKSKDAVEANAASAAVATIRAEAVKLVEAAERAYGRVAWEVSR